MLHGSNDGDSSPQSALAEVIGSLRGIRKDSESILPFCYGRDLGAIFFVFRLGVLGGCKYDPRNIGKQKAYLHQKTKERDST